MSFVSFPHRHSFLVPIPMGPPTPVESKKTLEFTETTATPSSTSSNEEPSKKRIWRRKMTLPDYRKTKIGEYQDDDDFGNNSDPNISASDTDSDNASLSSVESSTSIISSLSSQMMSTAQVQSTCSGCDLSFQTTSSFQLQLPSHHFHSQNQKASRSPFTQIVAPTMRPQAGIRPTKFRCLWPGCKVVVCSLCEPLLKTKKEFGGAGGNLELLRELRKKTPDMKKAQTPRIEPSGLIRPYGNGRIKAGSIEQADDLIAESSREEDATAAFTPSSSSVSSPGDGAVTADIVEAATTITLSSEQLEKREDSHLDIQEVVSGQDLGDLQRTLEGVVDEISEKVMTPLETSKKEIMPINVPGVQVGVKA